MKIQDSFEHEPLLNANRKPGKEEESRCFSCEKQGRQCVDIAAPFTVTPLVTMGSVTTACRGEPEVVCETSPDGSHCTVTFTQRLCFTLPLAYDVELQQEEPTIACADGGPGPEGPKCQGQ